MKKILSLIVLIISCSKVINNIKMLDKDINSDLINASKIGSINEVLNLLDKGADINNKDNERLLQMVIWKLRGCY